MLNQPPGIDGATATKRYRAVWRIAIPAAPDGIEPTPERLGKYSVAALLVAWMKRSGIQVSSATH